MRTSAEIRNAKRRNERCAKKLREGIGIKYTDDSGKVHELTTTSEPWQLGDGTWVIKLNTIAGGIDCSRVEPLPGVEQFKPNKRMAADGQKSPYSNGQKADFALHCVKEHSSMIHAEDALESEISDFLANLMHLCQRENLFFYGLMERARMNHEFER